MDSEPGYAQVFHNTEKQNAYERKQRHTLFSSFFLSRSCCLFFFFFCYFLSVFLCDKAHVCLSTFCLPSLLLLLPLFHINLFYFVMYCSVSGFSIFPHCVVLLLKTNYELCVFFIIFLFIGEEIIFCSMCLFRILEVV